MYIADIYGELQARLLNDVFWMVTYSEVKLQVGHHLLNTQNMEHIKRGTNFKPEGPTSRFF
jgi:hypothetical protein